MPPENSGAPAETSQGPVEIRQDDAISIQDALLIAHTENVPVGKSTLQRWAKHWAEKSSASPVRCVLVTTRTGSAYRVDRDDFTAWLLDQKHNAASHEILRGPEKPQETSQDPVRSQETPRDAARSHEASTTKSFTNQPNDTGSDMLAQLRDENMQLRIDLEVRKRLLSQAASEHERQRGQTENLLRENGALQLQVRQLATGPEHPQLEAAEDTGREGQRPTIGGYDRDVDISKDVQHAGL